ncbi:MAG: S-layer homology domain-containing protein [Eubacteriales bacterium]|nr:S-layer homology domain-containing protein [Eubacteriales bacterium]
MKKLLSTTLALIMVLSSVSISVFANGTNKSERLAVYAKTNITGTSTMNIEGDSYVSDGDFVVGYGTQTNFFRGNIFYNKNYRYYQLNQYEEPAKITGEVIALDETQFPFKATEIPVAPTIANKYTDWNAPSTIDKDTYFPNFNLGWGTLTFDTTKGDINVVCDNVYIGASAEIKIIGGGTVNFFAKSDFNISSGSPKVNAAGAAESLNLYVGGTFYMGGVAQFHGNIYTNNTMYVNSKIDIVGSIYSNAKSIEIGSPVTIYGTLYAPEADVKIYGDCTVKGNVIAKSLYLSGNGQVIFDETTATIIPKFGVEEEPEVPEEPEQPEEDTSIKLIGVTNAYIFGYEPTISKNVDEEGNETVVVRIEMAPDDNVSVEQVSTMLMRLLDQSGKTSNNRYMVTPSIEKYRGTWFIRGLAYMVEQGGLDEETPVAIGDVTRAQVAKLIACALNLNLTKDVPFTDVANSEELEYIKKVYAYGYMNGMSSTEFSPNSVMTRAQFCRLFNNIIGRGEFGLTAINADGEEFTVTPKDYFITDLSRSHWAYEECLKATSSYNEDGYVDFELRQENIRNKVDQFDSQLVY